MNKLLREPLLHFVLLGAGLFAVDAALRDRSAGASAGEIVVTEGRVENLAAMFAKTHNRPPSWEELCGLVDDFVLEEALYREGQALGVDQDDTIIRRRVRQKMEFLVDDIVEQVKPSEELLRTWHEGHPDMYSEPERLMFRQVYLSRDRRGEALLTDATALLAELRQLGPSADTRESGDPSSLGEAFSDIGLDDVARDFGPGVAKAMTDVPVGEWSGPIESAFGLHLILIDARTPGVLADFTAVRAAVERDWSYAQREIASQRFYADVVDRYQVTVQWPVYEEDLDGEPSTGATE